MENILIALIKGEHMILKDYKNLILERSNDFLRDNTGGTVVKLPDDIGKNVYGVFIPRMMMGIPIDNGPFENAVNLSNGKCLNSDDKKFGASSVISSNYILLTMDTIYNLSMPKLICGENVTIGVIDQDIKSIYIKPFCRDQILNRPDDVMEMYVPASGKYKGDELSDANTYYMRCDSQNKKIRIHMSKANGEVSTYDIIIDGDSGYMSMSDGDRSFIINTNNDELVMSNKAETVCAIRGDTIDYTCKKFYLNAKDEIKIQSPKYTAEIKDSITTTTKEYTGNHDKMTIKGDKIIEEYTEAKITNTSRDIKSDTTSYDGLVEVSGALNANGGMSFGAPPGMDPIVPNPQVSAQGMANFAGPAGLMLAKAPPLMSLLTIIAAQADAAGLAGKPPVPPMASVAVAMLGSQISSVSVKG